MSGKGKVLQFRGRLSGEVIAAREADNETGQNERVLTSDMPDSNKAFGPDDFSFSWLVVGGGMARFDDDVSTFPLAQDGYSL